MATLAAAVLVVLGLVFVLLPGGSGAKSFAPGAVGGRPREISDVELDGAASAVDRLGDVVVVVQARSSSSGPDTVVAIELSTGNDLWTEDGSAAAVVSGSIVVGFEDELQRFDTSGREVGAPLRVGGEVDRISVAGRRIFVETDRGTTLVDADRWDVVTDDVRLVSADFGQVAELDVRDEDVRVQRIDPVTGQRVGDEIYIDASVDDVQLLDDGRLAVLDDENVMILDSRGDEVASFRGPRSADELVSGPDSLLMVVSPSESIVYRVSGNDVVELRPDVSGNAEFVVVAGGVFVITATSDGDVEAHQVSGGDVRRLFTSSGYSWELTSSGIYVLDDDQLDFYRLPGDGRSVWSVDRDTDERFALIDRLVVLASYDSVDETTKLTFLG